jgi:hypothetical protein
MLKQSAVCSLLVAFERQFQVKFSLATLGHEVSYVWPASVVFLAGLGHSKKKLPPTK